MTWENLIVALEILMAVVVAGGGILAVTQMIKTQFGLEGNQARMLNNVVAWVGAFVTLVVAGELGRADFNMVNLAATIPVLHMAAREMYAVLTGNEGRIFKKLGQ